MLFRMRNFIAQQLKRQGFTEAEAYRFLMSYSSNIFAFLVHFILMMVFIVFRGEVYAPKSDYPDFFIFLNLFSALGYLASFYFIYMRHYCLYGILLTLQGTICALLLCLLTGIDTYGIIYLILIIISQFKFPYGGFRLRILVIAITILLTIFCIVTSYFLPPSFILTARFKAFFLALNVTIFIIGIILMMFASLMLESIISRLREARIEELSNQSLTDELTGLYNRRFARKFFSKCIEGRIEASVAMLDVDDFKIVNDLYGHNCGDEVIVFLSDFIASNIRKSDVAVRWGGEEFLILASNTTLGEAYVLMEELREKIENTTIHTREKDINITVTIGIAELLNDMDNSIRACDKKMYEGKQAGKNVVVY